MKNIAVYLLMLSMIVLFTACENKTVKLLSKRWDCVKVDNLELSDSKFQSPEDSVKSLQVEAALKALTWGFDKDMNYECSVDGRLATHGTYTLTDDDKTLTCIPSTKNNINAYTISALTEDDLILNNQANNGNGIVMHFKPH